MSMDIGLRAWLMILGSILILGILVHGYWKMRVSRNPIKVKLDKSFVGEDSVDDGDDLDLLKGELPSGGARVIGADDQTSMEFSDTNARPDPALGDLHMSEGIDEDSPSIPVLMNAVELGNADKSSASVSTTSSSRSTADDRVSQTGREEKLIIFYLICKEGTINGQMLLEFLVPRNMSFGEMEIFHRTDDSGNILFSLANAVEPGSFKLSAIKDTETPGVILFMKLHELNDPEDVFSQMVLIAREISEELGCQIKDETQSVVTPQTIEHFRQTIQEYSHKSR